MCPAVQCPQALELQGLSSYVCCMCLAVESWPVFLQSSFLSRLSLPLVGSVCFPAGVDLGGAHFNKVSSGLLVK